MSEPCTEMPRVQARVDALTDHQRHVLLAYLCGLRPEVIDAALDDLGSARTGDGGEEGSRDG